jgi:hypothetical protein
MVDLPPYHHGDQGLLGDLGDRTRADQRAIAQHGHPVGELEDLGQLVADIDNGDAALAQAPDDRHQPLDVGIGQGSGGFVHDDDPGVLAQRLGDLHPLPIGDRQGADLGIHVEVGTIERI